MIKLLLLLFTFSTVYPQETIFNFPAHHSRFIHQINHSLKNSSHILIITPTYHHAELTKGLLASIKRGNNVKLIVQDLQGDPLSMVQYKRIDLYTSPAPLLQSILLIDEILVCTSNETLDDEILNFHHSSIRCSDEKGKIRAIRHSLTPLLKHSKSYLE